ncbi:hypothetical protein L3V86_09370 [Thiotrichales bacterium 19S11-10]|nr:hypothetical protein [Thiotrichales bacterium 19S11-10]
MSKPISIKLSEQEESFLKKVAIDNELFKNNDEPSLSKSLKFLLKKFMKSENNSHQNNQMNNVERLLEEIHLAIPHLIFNSNFNAHFNNLQLSKDNISKEKIDQFKLSTLENTKKMCGQFQQYDYKNINYTMNNKQMKIAPINDESNQWTY